MQTKALMGLHNNPGALTINWKSVSKSESGEAIKFYIGILVNTVFHCTKIQESMHKALVCYPTSLVQSINR